MKVRIDKPCRVNLLSGEVEVSETEYKRLMILGLVSKTAEKETPEEKTQKTTRKAKK